MNKFYLIAPSLLVFPFVFSGCNTPSEPEYPTPRAPRFAHYEGHPGAKYNNEDEEYGDRDVRDDRGGRGRYEDRGGDDRRDYRGPGPDEPGDDSDRGGNDRGDAPIREGNHRGDARARGPEARGEDRGRLPVGRPTRNAGFVISPYPPHNRIDVRGIPSGAKVMDPSVNKVFINP